MQAKACHPKRSESAVVDSFAEEWAREHSSVPTVEDFGSYLDQFVRTFQITPKPVPAETSFVEVRRKAR
jgi:hypothetical protein